MSKYSLDGLIARCASLNIEVRALKECPGHFTARAVWYNAPIIFYNGREKSPRSLLKDIAAGITQILQDSESPTIASKTLSEQHGYRTVSVNCPYCNSVHRHNITPETAVRGPMNSGCHQGKYDIAANWKAKA